MAETTFTFRFEEELKSAFTEAAKAQDQTGGQLLRAFMRDFVKCQQNEAEYDAWFLAQVQIGLDSADAGNLVPADEVEAEFAARREETRRKLGAPSWRS
jgi:predicted transcriptional regulator